MIDFKCYFYCHFFSWRNYIRSLRNYADWNGYVYIYWSQSTRGGWDLIYLFGITVLACIKIIISLLISDLFEMLFLLLCS